MIQLKDFQHGWVDTPDSGDLRGFRVFKNLDTRYSAGNTGLRVRPAVDVWSTLSNMPNPTDYTLYRIERWESGISTIQTNTLLVYRSASATSGRYGWRFYSDAPDGGDGATWTNHENVDNSVGSADIEIETIKGAVRIFMGNQQNYRILINLVPDGVTRNYCTANMTVSTTGVTGRAAALQLGAGGTITKGWLWDYGKLYQPWSTPQLDIQVAASRDDTKGIPVTWTDVNAFVIAVAPEYDDPGQVGVPWGYTTLPYFMAAVGIGGGGYFTFAVQMETEAGFIFSPRIKSFGVYARMTMQDGSGDIDLTRVGTIDVNSLPNVGAGFATVFTLDGAVWQSQTVRSWFGDTENRPLPAFPAAGAGADAETSAAAITAEENAITIKAAGAMISDERVYAWGSDDDDGQTHVRYSELPGQFGSYDVFREEFEMWKGGVKYAIEKLVSWNGRILELHRTGVYYCDGYNENRADRWYIYHSDTVGIGLPHAYRRTLTVGSKAVYWANESGVWRFADDRPDNILTGRLLDVWLNISTANREASIGGYNHKRDEFWLAVRSGDGLQDTSYAYSYWVWSEDQPQWKLYELPTRVTPWGMWTDEGVFLIYGPTTIANAPEVLEFEADVDIDYGITPISYAIKSQKTGERSRLQIAKSVDLQRLCDSDHTMAVSFYVNGNTAISSTVRFTGSNTQMITMKEIAFQSVEVYLSGTYSGGTRPEIYELSVDTVTMKKRRR